mmetsp:Transcript_8724/g.19583  ORF Transcript_8724/g.19583 Transcript_8724/m.19583 type:complete len:227 (-) Transcript_8724:916-1596(-)
MTRFCFNNATNWCIISTSRINIGGSPRGACTSIVFPILCGPATCSPVHKCIQPPSGKYTLLLTTPLFNIGTTYTKSPNMNADALDDGTPLSPPPLPPLFFFVALLPPPLKFSSFGKCNIGCRTTGYPLKLASFNNCNRYSDKATYTLDHFVSCFNITSSSYALIILLLPPLLLLPLPLLTLWIVLSFTPQSPSCVRNNVVNAVISNHRHIISRLFESILFPIALES